MQEWFEQAVNAIKEWLQSPLGTSIISITTTFIYLLVIFSKTSLGKKLYNKVLNKYDGVVKIAHESNEKVKEIQNLATDKINALESHYEQELTVITNYALELENFLYQLGETIPNEKVKKLVNDFRENKVARFSEIQKYIPTVNEINELKDELKKTQEQFADEVQKARQEIENALKLEYQKAFEKLLEEQNNERKENENTNAD